MMRSYKIRLKPTKRQQSYLSALLVHLCELYNICLEQRRDHWRQGRSVSYYDQQKELTELRSCDETYGAYPAVIQRDPLRRINLAFKHFFRRCQAGESPGYPRFRSPNRYDSFIVDSQNVRIDNGIAMIATIGGIRFKTRCRIRGSVRQLTVKHVGNLWEGTVVVDIGEIPQKVTVAKAIGIDVGLTSLATMSDGSTIKNPRWEFQAREELARIHRALSRKQKGSRNRVKAKEIFRRIHRKVAARRKSYLHGVSRWLVDNYDLIAYEKLNIKNMAGSHLAKSIMDAAWNELLWQIAYKAESAGKWAVPVNPRGTTQNCSGCGKFVLKTLWQRDHICTDCGLQLGRDHNAALNILALGESAAGMTSAEVVLLHNRQDNLGTGAP